MAEAKVEPTKKANNNDNNNGNDISDDVDDPKITDKYVLFLNGIFCQWYPVTFKDDDGTLYYNAEQYMMAQKALLMGDKNIFKEILKSKDPNKCKQLGRKVKNWDQKKWDNNKQKIVYKGNLLKFSTDKLKKEILNDKYSNKIFVEAASFDRIWGIGLDISDPDCNDKSKWNGLNLLGNIITQVRDELLKQSKKT